MSAPASAPAVVLTGLANSPEHLAAQAAAAASAAAAAARALARAPGGGPGLASSAEHQLAILSAQQSAARAALAPGAPADGPPTGLESSKEQQEAILSAQLSAARAAAAAAPAAARTAALGGGPPTGLERSEEHAVAQLSAQLSAARVAPTPAAPAAVHIVFFKWKAGTSDAALAAMRDAILGLKAAMPGVITEISFGKTFTDRGRGFTHALLVKFPAPDCLPVYDAHPAHQALVKEHVAPVREDVMAIDYVEGVV